MVFTPKALALLKQLEGCRLAAYQDQAGVWTIGYGHTGRDVSQGTMWTQDFADMMLDVDVQAVVSGVTAIVHPFAPLTDNQFSALVIFAFNVGIAALMGSTLLRHVNGGLDSFVPDDFMQWIHIHKGGQVVVDPGLQKRRAAEAALWNSN